MPQTDDVLSDINEKTTKPVLLQKIRELADRLHAREDERVARMQELEEKLRERFQPADVKLKSVTIMSTPEEFEEAIDFLENFEELMPTALHRLLAGLRAVTGQTEV